MSLQKVEVRFNKHVIIVLDVNSSKASVGPQGHDEIIDLN